MAGGGGILFLLIETRNKQFNIFYDALNTFVLNDYIKSKMHRWYETLMPIHHRLFFLMVKKAWRLNMQELITDWPQIILSALANAYIVACYFSQFLPQECCHMLLSDCGDWQCSDSPWCLFLIKVIMCLFHQIKLQ